MEKIHLQTTETTVADSRWSAVVFGDLHVRADTLTRACQTLEFVGDLAETKQSMIVCVGDFWDIRGVLSVRQADAVMNIFDRWHEKGIDFAIVPGNHDQVDREGLIHGIRVFSQYDNVRVYDSPAYDEVRGQLFIPWIEDPRVQRAVFASVPNGATVFAHGEAPGSVANSGHRMDGRFDLPNEARAVYLGHFHKRQKLGDRCWYIGSPFELDIGERNSEHGVAFVTSSGSIIPEWHEIPRMPKHYVIRWDGASEEELDPAIYRAEDIVKFEVTAAERRSPEFREHYSTFRETVRATRTALISVDAAAVEEELPEGASIASGLELYLRANRPDGSFDQARSMGLEVLKELPDVRSVARLGSVIRFGWLEVTGFCAARDIRVSLNSQGAVLLRGPMGSGKTSLTDAVTWCLFDTTTPRKAGESKAALRGDEVVHDDADLCVVSLEILIEPHTYRVVRQKKRGKGSVVTIYVDGEPHDQPVKDANEMIQKLVGLPYNWWRAAVYLGQGSVANFVTDARTARMELLSSAVGLGVCTEARKLVRSRSSHQRTKMQQVITGINRAEGELSVLRERDFDAEIQSWEERRRSQIESCTARVAELQMTVSDYDAQLVKGRQFRKQREDATKHLRLLEDQLAASGTSNQAAQARDQLTRTNVEFDTASRDLEAARQSYQQLMASPATATCDKCGQLLPAEHRDTMISKAESTIVGKETELESLSARRVQLQADVDRLAAGSTGQTDAIKTQLSDWRGRLSKLNQAVGMLDTMRARRADAAKEWEGLLGTIKAKQEERNPFELQREDHQVKVDDAERRLLELKSDLQGIEHQVYLWEYWDTAFGPDGIVAIVLRAVRRDLEHYVNEALTAILGGVLSVEIDEELELHFFELVGDTPVERLYRQFSGGYRRCLELAFTPFGLGELLFRRLGVHAELLVIDELTTHLEQAVKPLLIDFLSTQARETTVVIDHDETVQGSFDQVWDMRNGALVDG